MSYQPFPPYPSASSWPSSPITSITPVWAQGQLPYAPQTMGCYRPMNHPNFPVVVPPGQMMYHLPLSPYACPPSGHYMSPVSSPQVVGHFKSMSTTASSPSTDPRVKPWNKWVVRDMSLRQQGVAPTEIFSASTRRNPDPSISSDPTPRSGRRPPARPNLHSTHASGRGVDQTRSPPGRGFSERLAAVGKKVPIIPGRNNELPSTTSCPSLKSDNGTSSTNKSRGTEDLDIRDAQLDPEWETMALRACGMKRCNLCGLWCDRPRQHKCKVLAARRASMD